MQLNFCHRAPYNEYQWPSRYLRTEMMKKTVGGGSPPIVELVLGVLAKPVRSFTSAHAGVFWRENYAEWPSIKEAPHLVFRRESFQGQDLIWPLDSALHISSKPRSRIQIANKDATRMIQIQEDSFHYNWRRTTDQEYPGFGSVMEECLSAVDQYKQFVKGTFNDGFHGIQWEVTYVDVITPGELWTQPNQIGRVLQWIDLSQLSGDQSALASLGFRFQFKLSLLPGSLDVSIEYKQIESACPEPVFLITWTARGPLGESSEGLMEAVRSGFEAGHDAITRQFKELTTVNARKFWGV